MSMDYIDNPEAAKEYLPRYNLIYVLLAFTFTAFTFRLWYLQIIQGDELRDFSEKNRIKEVKKTAPRGLFLDREGRILVENLSAYDAMIFPQYLEDSKTTAATVGKILGIEGDRILARIEKSRKQNGPFAPVKIKENLNLDEVFRLRRARLELPGVDIRENVIRSYPLGPNGAQIFGYVSEISKSQLPKLNNEFKNIFSFEQGDIIGKSGIEKLLDIEIRGKDGFSFIQVDAHGREIETEERKVLGQAVTDIEYVPGRNVQLTIDKDIQEAAYKSFTGQERIGAVVAMKTNGEILAWLSTPSYDPNEFARGIGSRLWQKLINDPFKPLRNKVIQDYASPGSTFKPLVALAALQEKVISPSTVINAPGAIRFGNRLYHDHLKGGHGNITVFEALERSSNVFFYKMGIALGIDNISKYVRWMGLGSKTGIELEGENPGILPTTEWKKQKRGEEWQPGENLSNAIGQGFVVSTALQMAISYNTIGLEGKVYKPFVIKRVTSPEGQVLREYQPEMIRDLQQTQPNGVKIDASTFKTVKEGMRRVANGERGTAKWWKIPGVQMAGKTGTSQVMSFSADQIYAECTTRPIHMRHHGWYIAFAPVENPEITVAVLAEHACHGSTGGAPIARDIILAYMQKHHPDIIEAAIKKGAARPVPTPPPQPQVEGE